LWIGIQSGRMGSHGGQSRPASGGVSHLDRVRYRPFFSGFSTEAVCLPFLRYIGPTASSFSSSVKSRNLKSQIYRRVSPFSTLFERFAAMLEVIIILLLFGFVYYAARWIVGRSNLYCETCHLNTYVDQSGWCHNCHRTYPQTGTF